MRLQRRTLKSVVLMILLAGFSIALTGCSVGGGPRSRWGWTPNVQFGDPNRLGTHSYGFGGGEGFGIFYTLRGGSIDMDHTRGAGDLTRWTYIRAKSTIEKGGSQFTVGPAFEMTTNKVRLEYPDNWNALPQTEKERIAHEAALIIAPVVGYHSTLWHEMITWKGTHFFFIEPEHTSAFSWDDLYSNLMGVELATEAIKEGHVETSDYNRAMTTLINEELERLGVVSRERTREITETVRGAWYTTGKLMRRNMDSGYDDGMVTPSIIPGFTDKEPISRALPTFDGLEELGIKVTYTISSAYFENGKLKKIAGRKTSVEPVKDYPVIMKNIEQEAIDKYGYEIR